uniref:Ovule protein n=1 Tax=Bursaphelenchus xylophilus TaxID=6326 RepID=A0A1I7SGZ8_BURXY
MSPADAASQKSSFKFLKNLVLDAGPRNNIAHRQIAHQPVAGSSIRARFDPNRGQPSQHYYQPQQGQPARYLPSQFSQRVIRVSSAAQAYPPNSQPPPPEPN